MKKILKIMMITILFMTSINAFEIKATSTTYYVSSQLGSDDYEGITLKEPLNSLNAALAKANHFDQIVFLDDIHVNDLNSNDEPLVIDKAVTIKGYNDQNYDLNLRCGGILLGADVTFQNINVGTSSFIRPAIAANGHELTLINVHQIESLRPLQIYGGTFFDYREDFNGHDYGEDIRGLSSVISIYGGSFEGIYAGSINGTVDLDVSIEISKIYEEQKYQFSVDQGVFVGSTLKNANDLTTAGQIPLLTDSIMYSNNATIALKDNVLVKQVDGIHESSHVCIKTNANGYYELMSNQIDEYIVEAGTLALTGSIGDCDVTLIGSSNNYATLNLSEFENQEIHVNKFIGSEYGILEIASSSSFVIDTSLSGISEFRVDNGMPWSSNEYPGYSGYMEIGKTYITLNGTNLNGGFEIRNPYATQEHLLLKVEEGKYWISAEEYEYGVCELTQMLFVESFIETTKETIHSMHGLDLMMDVTFTQETIDAFNDYISYIPLKYQVTYTDLKGNITQYHQQMSLEDSNVAGNYFCEYIMGEYQILFEPFSNFDTDIPYYYIKMSSDDLPAGIYDIEVSDKEHKTTITLNVDGDQTWIPTQITTNIEAEYQYLDQLPILIHMNGVEEGMIEVWINDFKETLHFENGEVILELQVDETFGFQIGENKIEVIYKESEPYLQSSIHFDITVIKAESDFHYEIEHMVYPYDGNTHAYSVKDIQVFKKGDENEVLLEQINEDDYELYYYHNGSISNTLPKNVGEYEVWMKVLEHDCFKESELKQIAKIQIQAVDVDLNFVFQEITYLQDEEVKASALISWDCLDYDGMIEVYDCFTQVKIAQVDVKESMIKIDDLKISQLDDLRMNFHSNDPSVSSQTACLIHNLYTLYLSSEGQDYQVNGVIGITQLYLATNQQVELYAGDVADKQFVEWKMNDDLLDDVDLQTKTIRFTMVSNDIHIQALWKSIEQVFIDVDCLHGGSVSGEGYYEKNQPIELNAIAKEGYRFIGWFENGECISDEEHYIFDTNEDKVITAKFILSFVDVDQKQWYYNVVEKAYDQGLMKNTGKGIQYFEPDANITRGMVATVLYRMANMPEVDLKQVFPDVNPSLWYGKAIKWAADHKIVNGFADGTFKPDQEISRQELAIMLRNYATTIGLDTSKQAKLTRFVDYEKVDGYAQSAVAWCVEIGLMSGSETSEGMKLNPKAKATRAECAKLFSLLNEKSNNK